uniref:Cellulase n=1 Tax=Alexandrium andersonii TaxID=327968 RepID=A0A7S2G3W3_9DINO|mmetsp:Transcript_39389/g.89548  ORF Transcript_39389/g.89548 Transcript_39389/m.89548 type:complete len:154 (+) Transcript_39389:104-565(+)
MAGFGGHSFLLFLALSAATSDAVRAVEEVKGRELEEEKHNVTQIQAHGVAHNMTAVLVPGVDFCCCCVLTSRQPWFAWYNGYNFECSTGYYETNVCWGGDYGPFNATTNRGLKEVNGLMIKCLGTAMFSREGRGVECNDKYPRGRTAEVAVEV